MAMTDPTTPSAMEEAEKIVAHYAEGPFTLQDMIARALSERDERIVSLNDRVKQVEASWHQMDDAYSERLRVEGYNHTILAQQNGELQAQLRERDRELRDTTTTLAAAYHELERTDQVHADLAEREREVAEFHVANAEIQRLSDIHSRARHQAEREVERLREYIRTQHGGWHDLSRTVDDCPQEPCCLLTRRPAPVLKAYCRCPGGDAIGAGEGPCLITGHPRVVPSAPPPRQ